jgi:hypothetical protein
MTNTASATSLQLLGAGCFGAILGWFLYFINRYRSDTIGLTDLTTVAGAIGGGAVLTLFPEGTDLFGAYGVGLFFGFFGYFAILVVLVRRSPNFDADWFLDGRSRRLDPDSERPAGPNRAMESRPDSPVN